MKETIFFQHQYIILKPQSNAELVIKPSRSLVPAKCENQNLSVGSDDLGRT